MAEKGVAMDSVEFCSKDSSIDANEESKLNIESNQSENMEELNADRSENTEELNADQTGNDTMMSAMATAIDSTVNDNHSDTEYSNADSHKTYDVTSPRTKPIDAQDALPSRVPLNADLERKSQSPTSDSAKPHLNRSNDTSRLSSADATVVENKALSRAESLRRKEREEKVKATREKMEEEKKKKLQELLDAQRLAEEVRLKQQEIRKKKLESLKSRDTERQKAAEERRRKRELEEEERKRNFLKKRLDKANRAELEVKLKKGKHESYGFGSSAPRFEEIILTASPGKRSLSQVNLSALKKTGVSGTDESDHDSPRPSSALLGENSSSPRGPFDDVPLYVARPLSKSTTNINIIKKRVSEPPKPRAKSSTPAADQMDTDSPVASTKSTELPEAIKKRISRLSASKASSDSPNTGSKKLKSAVSSADESPKVSHEKRSSSKSERRSADKNTDSDALSPSKIVGQHRSNSASRSSKTPDSNSDSRSKTLERPMKALSASKADIMSKSKSVGNIAKASAAKKDQELKQQEVKTPVRNSMTKSASSEPVKSSPIHKPKAAAVVGETESPSKSGSNTSTEENANSLNEAGDGGLAIENSEEPSALAAEAAEPVDPVTGESEMQLEVQEEPMEEPVPQAEVPTEATAVHETEKASQPEIASTPQQQQPKSSKATEIDEYKAKLAEKRREAREKAEREAEEERRRLEAERLAEETRQREEEERERLAELEQERLAAEAKEAEEARLAKAIEEEDRRKKEEAERIESEKKAREEAAEKQRTENEKREKEKQERIAKEEQEKMERKKKLENIMKRVKTSSPTPERTQPIVEPSAMSTSMSGSFSSLGSSGSAFKSPLLQGLTNNNASEKKFSSPLLNTIMAKVSTERGEDNSNNSSLQASPEHIAVKTERDVTAAEDSHVMFSIGDNTINGQHGIVKNTKENGLHKNSSSEELISLSSDFVKLELKENGVGLHHQNGIGERDIDEQKQENLEQIITLSHGQSDHKDLVGNPEPIIAFENSSMHTEEVH